MILLHSSWSSCLWVLGNKHCELICFFILLCPWLLQSFHPSFYNDSWTLEGESVVMYVPFRVQHFSVSYSLCLGQLCVSVLIIIYCKWKLLRWGLKDVLIYGSINQPLGLDLILCWFSKMIVLIACLAIDLFLAQQLCLGMGFILLNGIKSNQIIIGFSHDVHAIIVGVDMKVSPLGPYVGLNKNVPQRFI